MDDPKGDHDPMEDLQIKSLRVGDEHGINESPIEIHKDECDDVGPFIQENTLEDMAIVDPCDIEISEFFYINKRKWDINHHFDNDPIYDTDKEDEVEINSTFSRTSLIMIYLLTPLKRRITIFPCMKKGYWK